MPFWIASLSVSIQPSAGTATVCVMPIPRAIQSHGSKCSMCHEPCGESLAPCVGVTDNGLFNWSIKAQICGNSSVVLFILTLAFNNIYRVSVTRKVFFKEVNFITVNSELWTHANWCRSRIKFRLNITHTPG